MTPALDGLRDIHAPPEPGIWPLAPGWYALALVGLALFAAAALALRRAILARRPRRHALAELENLARRHDRGATGSEVAAELSTLLRRVALHRFGRAAVGGLAGGRWIEFLDATGGDFAPHAELLESAYRPEHGQDLRPVLDSARHWIERNLR